MHIPSVMAGEHQSSPMCTSFFCFFASNPARSSSSAGRHAIATGSPISVLFLWAAAVLRRLIILSFSMLYYTLSASLGTNLLDIMELEVVTIHGPPQQYESIPHSTQSATEAHTQERVFCAFQINTALFYRKRLL